MLPMPVTAGSITCTTRADAQATAAQVETATRTTDASVCHGGTCVATNGGQSTRMVIPSKCTNT